MIFSPYFTTKAKGTGLGLSGARRAIQAQGAIFAFKSSPGEGTTFFVSLPIAKDQERQVLKPRECRFSSAGMATFMESAKAKSACRKLLVDRRGWTGSNSGTLTRTLR